jgi:hypothetical protein
MVLAPAIGVALAMVAGSGGGLEARSRSWGAARPVGRVARGEGLPPDRVEGRSRLLGPRRRPGERTAAGTGGGAAAMPGLVLLLRPCESRPSFQGGARVARPAPSPAGTQDLAQEGEPCPGLAQVGPQVPPAPRAACRVEGAARGAGPSRGLPGQAAACRDCHQAAFDWGQFLALSWEQRSGARQKLFDPVLSPAPAQVPAGCTGCPAWRAARGRRGA